MAVIDINSNSIKSYGERLSTVEYNIENLQSNTEINKQLEAIPNNPNAVPKSWDVFVIYGQSNAFGFAGNTPGRGTIPTYSMYWKPSTASIVPLVYEMENTNPGTPTSDGNAWIEFARKYREETGRGVIFLHCPMGDKTLAQLSKTGQGYYTNMVNAINVVQGAVSGVYTIRKWIMLFCQGENDQYYATSRDAYVGQLNQLLNDLKSETPITKMYISKVGNPQYVPEKQLYDVQVAQEYVCQTNPDIIMGFDRAGAFTISNGLLRTDGVHYTQLGYNIMGSEMGLSVAKCEKSNSSITDTEIRKYGSLQVPADQIYRTVSATFRHDGTNFVLQTLDNSDKRCSFIDGFFINSAGLAATLATKVDDVLFIETKLNAIGIQNCLKLSAYEDNTNNSKNIVLEFRHDANFLVNTSNGAISYPPNGSGADNGLLGSVTGTVTGGHVQIDHLGSSMIPFVAPVGYGNGDIDNWADARIVVPSATQFWIKYSTSPAPTNTLVYCALPSMKIDPTKIKLAGLEVTVFAIVAERSR